MAYENSWGRIAGFREVAEISAENTSPIPTPAPASPIVDSPAPMNFAASCISIFVIVWCFTTGIELFFSPFI